MKARNLFLSLCAFAAICSCNKEIDPVVDNEVLGEDTFIQVNIVAAKDATKGTDGGTVVGTAAENEVKNAMLIFFASNGEFVEAREYNEFTWNTSSSNNVEKVSSIVVVLKGKTIVPRQVVAVLNYPQSLKEQIAGVENRPELYQLVADSPISVIDATDAFLMTNSVYMDGGTVNYYTQIADSHMYTGDEAPAGYKPLEIYVERVAAKVKVSGTPTASVKTLTLHSGDELHYYPTVTGVSLTNTSNKSFLLKHIHNYNTLAGWTWVFDGWNDVTNHRSYWANSYDGAGYTKVSYSGIGTEKEWTRYYNENTIHAYHTQLLVAATIKQAADAHTMNPATDPAIGDLVKFGPTYYTLDDFLTVVANEVAALGVKVGGAAFDKTKLVLKHDTGFYSYVALADAVAFDTPAMQTAAAAKIAEYDDVLFWEDGMSYFFTHVEHFGPDAGVNAYGLVRNHYYDITLNSIAGLGTPISGGSILDDIDPEKPTDLDYNLAAKINILRWKVVSQSVDLN